MKKMLTIKRDLSIQVESRITSFLTPSYLYIPLAGSFNLTAKDVKKGQYMGFCRNFPYFSPVSGNIVNIQTINKQKYLVIANDFKETKEKKTEKSNKLLKELIKKYCSHLNWDNKSEIKTLYFNGLNDNLYDVTTTFYHKTKTAEILDMLDLLREHLHLQNVVILLKENDTESIEAFQERLGTYLFIFIKYIPDVYPISNNKILKDFLKQPDALILKTLEGLVINDALVEQKPLLEIYVTFSGDLIFKRRVFKVKIGTRAADIIEQYYPNLNIKQVYVNNLLANNLQNLDDIIITPEISALLFFKPVVYKSRPCISCGKCIELCPMGCNPIEKQYQNCINCGLCSYICPAYISLNPKEEVEHEKSL